MLNFFVKMQNRQFAKTKKLFGGWVGGVASHDWHRGCLAIGKITKLKSDAVDCEKYRQVKGGWVEERHMTGVRLLEPPEATTAPPPPPPPAVH